MVFFFQAEDAIRDLTVTGVQTCALPICPAVHIESWQELRTGLTGRCPSLLDSRQCRRKIEVLITRLLHDAREHRVVEAIPPGFEGRRRGARRVSRVSPDTVEGLERRRGSSIRGANGATRHAELRKQAERGENGQERPHNDGSIGDKPHVRPWLAPSTPSIQCSTRSTCSESRGVARDTLAQQKLPRCRLRVAVGYWACLSRGLP